MVNWIDGYPYERFAEPIWIWNEWQNPYGVYVSPPAERAWLGVPGRGWLTDSYPDLAPYYPVPVANVLDSDWVHPWLYPPYQGYWWS